MLARQVAGNVGDGLGQHRSQADVVAVEGDVDAADRDDDALDLLQGLGQLAAERNAAGLQADEDDVVEPVVVLDDLVGHAPHGPLHVLRAHHPFPGNKNAPVRGRQSTFSFSHCTSSCPYGPHGTRFTVRSAG